MRNSKVRTAALKAGWRSGLEASVGAQLKTLKVKYAYERLKISFTSAPKIRRYTPDFVLLDSGIIIETKGRFLSADRQKHLAVKAEHPEYDIRFVFSNAAARISKTSGTSYGQWCEKHGFLFASKLIPLAWINERRKTTT